MSFLLDTDGSSAYLKENPKLVNRQIQHGGRLSVSAITMGEFATWALRAKASPRRLPDLHAFLKFVDVIDIGEDIALKFGEVRAAPLDVGHKPPR